MARRHPQNFTLLVYILSTWTMLVLPMEKPKNLQNDDIHNALRRGDRGVDDLIADLLNADGDINKPDASGQTLLQIARETKQRGIVHFLLFQGAVVDVEDITDDILDAFSPSPDEKRISDLILQEDNLDELQTQVSQYRKRNRYSISTVLPGYLWMAVSQARPKAVKALLDIEESTECNFEAHMLFLLDRLLKNIRHTAAQHARYEAILDLLRMHESRASQAKEAVDPTNQSERLAAVHQSPLQIPSSLPKESTENT